MKKQVNIFANTPITFINIPIVGTVRNITMKSEDIRKCLFAKAKVEEILPSGKTVKLDFTNYNTENVIPSSDKIKNNIQKPVVTPAQALKSEVKPIETKIKEVKEDKKEEVKPILEEKTVETSIKTEEKSNKKK